VSTKQGIFIGSVQKELALEHRTGTKSALSQGPSRDQVEILAKSSTGAALSGFVVIAKIRLGPSFGTKCRHQVIQPQEIPASRALGGVAGQTGHKWAKRAKRARNDMKHHKQSHAQGGLGKVHQLFGAELPKVIEELNRELAA
jgi:hypothetical protein